MSSSLLKKGGGKALKRPADDSNSSDNDSDGVKPTAKRVRFADVPPSPGVIDQKTSLAVFKKSVEKALEGKKAVRSRFTKTLCEYKRSDRACREIHNDTMSYETSSRSTLQILQRPTRRSLLSFYRYYLTL